MKLLILINNLSSDEVDCLTRRHPRIDSNIAASNKISELIHTEAVT